MKKILITFAIWTGVSASLVAQTPDSVRCAPVTTLRKALSDLAWDGHYDTLLLRKQAFESLHPDLGTVTPAERLLIDFWNERYEDVFETLEHPAPATPCIYDDALWNVLSYQASENLQDLNEWIDQSGYSAGHIDLLHDLLYDLAGQSDGVPYDSAVAILPKYGKRLGRVVEENLERDLNPYKAKIPIPIDAQSDYNFFFYLYGGPTLLSGNITHFFRPNQMYGINIGGSTNRLIFSFGMSMTMTSLLRDFPSDDNELEWLKGDMSAIMNLNLKMGIAALETRFWRITPYAGISLNVAAPARMESDDADSPNSPSRVTASPVLGGDVKFKLPPFRSTGNRFFFCGDIAFMPGMLGMSDSRFTGDMVAFFFGFGWMIR